MQRKFTKLAFYYEEYNGCLKDVKNYADIVDNSVGKVKLVNAELEDSTTYATLCFMCLNDCFDEKATNSNQ